MSISNGIDLVESENDLWDQIDEINREIESTDPSYRQFCVCCGKRGVTAGHMDCQYPQDME